MSVMHMHILRSEAVTLKGGPPCCPFQQPQHVHCTHAPTLPHLN